jgi:hypothetical protein
VIVSGFGALNGWTMICAEMPLVFSILFIWYSRNTGHGLWTYWAPFLLAGAALLLSIPVYAARRVRAAGKRGDCGCGS